jgi:uncharacterized protein
LVVVSNTTPISELAKVGRLNVLHAVYGSVVVPREVHDEVTAGSHPAVTAVRSANWIDVRSVSNAQAVSALHAATRLGLGECAAILLAEELHADRILIDDRAARRAAKARGLVLGGTIGTLLLAKEQGIISSVGEVLDELIAHGTRISDGLRTEALAAAGE